MTFNRETFNCEKNVSSDRRYKQATPDHYWRVILSPNSELLPPPLYQPLSYNLASLCYTMVQAKKPTSQPSKKYTKKPLDRIVEKQRAASAATQNKRTTQATRRRTSTTSSKKPVKDSTAPLADGDQDPENMSPAPTEVMRKSNRKVRLTEKMMRVLATSKPKAAAKAKKPKTKKQILGEMDSNMENAEIEYFKHGDHSAKGNNTLPKTHAPQQGGREVDLQRENDELKRWLI